MHIHLAPAPGQAGDAAQRALAVMLAHGVTTARTMAGNPVHLGVREGLATGRIVGPRLYAAAPAIHQGNAKTPDEARAAVAAAASAGFDLIKSHQIADVAVWQAVQDEAARRRIPVAGHVANEIGLGRALAAGQQIEHLDAMLFELLPVGAPERAIPFAQIPPPPVIDAVARATDAQIGALVRKVAAAGRAFQVPTLSLFELVADTSRSAAELRARPADALHPAAALDAWAAQRAEMAGMGFTADHAARFREIRRRLVRALHRAGVPLMAGSDTAQAFHIWGPGLIEEVEALGRGRAAASRRAPGGHRGSARLFPIAAERRLGEGPSGFRNGGAGRPRRPHPARQGSVARPVGAPLASRRHRRRKAARPDRARRDARPGGRGCEGSTPAACTGQVKPRPASADQCRSVGERCASPPSQALSAVSAPGRQVTVAGSAQPTGSSGARAVITIDATPHIKVAAAIRFRASDDIFTSPGMSGDALLAFPEDGSVTDITK
jgi:hypothetical protein